MNFGIDIDGTADAFPILFQHLIAGWKAAGDHVYIITGVSETEVTDADHEAKVGYLTALGIPPEMYDELIVCPQPHAENKLKVIEDKGIDLLIDNSVSNSKAAISKCAVFLLYNVKYKGDKGLSEPDKRHGHEHSHGHGHTIRADGVEMCCNGQTAAQHRAESGNGLCCVDTPDTIHGTHFVNHLTAGEELVVPGSALHCIADNWKDAGAVSLKLVPSEERNFTPLQRNLKHQRATGAALPERRGGYPTGLVNWYNDGADGAINWGEPGDFEDCVSVAGNYIDNPEGFCNLRHQDATGAPPGHAPGEDESKALTPLANLQQRWDRTVEARGDATVDGKPGRSVAVATYYRPKLVAAYAAGRAHIATVLRRLYTDAWVAGVVAAVAGPGGDALAATAPDLDAGDDWAVGWAETASLEDDAVPTGLQALLAQVETTAANIVAFQSQDGAPDPDTQAEQMADTCAATGCEAGAQGSYTAAGIDEFNVVLDDGACEVCQDKQDGGPYDVGDDDGSAPYHPGCGCESSPVTSEES